MDSFIKTANHEIHLLSCKVTYNGENLKIRTKTFLLLKFLVESQGQVVSKEKILNEVWDDVVTDDQVIFQSIKELRKIFVGLDVIKTYPRKGYAWIPQVSYEKILPVHAQAVETHTPRTRISRNMKYLVLLFSLMLITVIFMMLSTKQPQDNANKGSIIILPVVNELFNIDHQWIRLGVMDQIIHQLPSSDQYGILQTDDVLEILKRANLPKSDLKRKDINRIFSVSGATLIVESRLSGSLKEYQLIYSLHKRDGLERGVIMGENITLMSNQLAMLVGKKTNLSLNNDVVQYHSDFANEMLASALEKINTEDFDAAKILLMAAKEIEPTNLVISRHLASVLIIKKQLQEADDLLVNAISIAKKQGNSRELGRLYTILSQEYLLSGHYNKAIESLIKAENNAKKMNDWLYLGYITSIRGKAYQHTEQYILAKKAFESSINYHQVIQCPFGQARGFLELAELAISQGDYKVAQLRVNRSLTIIEERKLINLQKVALLVESTINEIED